MKACTNTLITQKAVIGKYMKEKHHEISDQEENGFQY